MPFYEFEHPKTGKIFSELRPFSRYDEPFIAPDGVQCRRLISAPQIKISADKPDRYERKEQDHRKKTKDPDRARRKRKDMFGTEGISITKSPHYHKQKQIKAQGSSDVDKREFVKAAAQNPKALAEAKRITGK